jgi:hypothetical protein
MNAIVYYLYVGFKQNPKSIWRHISARIPNSEIVRGTLINWLSLCIMFTLLILAKKILGFERLYNALPILLFILLYVVLQYALGKIYSRDRILEIIEKIKERGGVNFFVRLLIQLLFFSTCCLLMYLVVVI